MTTRAELHAALDAAWDARESRRRALHRALDAEFKESEHPRKDDGKFGKGSGGAVKPSMPKGMEHAEKIQE